MGGYWDALSRAALGEPGSAAPRPRSLFETDDPFTESPVLESFDDEVNSPLPGPAQTSQAAVPGDAAPGSAAPAETAADVDEDDAADQETAGTGASDLPAAVLAQAAPSAVAEPPPVAPAVASRVERIEVHRHETVQRVDPPTAPSVAAREVPMQAVNEAGQAFSATPPASPAPARDVETVSAAPEDEPLAVVAQPLATEPQPERHSAVVEPRPLVIEIDRIEIRIEHEPGAPAATPRPRVSAVVPSLDEYLARRSQGTR